MISEARRELAARIAGACTLRGEFLLRSGQTATEYFDKYQLEGRPDILAPLAEWMSELLPPGAELLGGLELGGVPLATAISLRTGIPAVFVRKQAKAYGTRRAVEGPSVAGRRVVVVEDVVTTGGQIVESVGLMRAEGAVIDHVVCAIWRGSDLTPLMRAGLTLRWALTKADLTGP